MDVGDSSAGQDRLEVRLYGGGFKTEFAAKLAGEKALGEFLHGLAQPQSKNNPVHSQACRPMTTTLHLAGSAVGRCSSSARFRGWERTPGLFVFHCTRCNRAETRQQPSPAGQS